MRILFVFVVLISFNSFTQENLSYRPKLDFVRTPVNILDAHPSFNFSQRSVLGPERDFHPMKPIVKGKPYEAFFCKLEVKSEAFAGFGIQFHAGDYYRDMNSNFEFRTQD